MLSELRGEFYYNSFLESSNFKLIYRFVTNPASMASLLGMSILQFLGVQAMWILLMAISSTLKRKRRSTPEKTDMEINQFLSNQKESDLVDNSKNT